MKSFYKSTRLLLLVTTFFLFACASPSDKGLANSVTVEFTLQTVVEDGKLGYRGIGGDIDGIFNPDLIVQPDAIVRIILVNGDGMTHDLFLADFDAKTEYVKAIGEQTELVFEIGSMQSGAYVYYCTVPGHRQAGQEGKLIIAKP